MLIPYNYLPDEFRNTEIIFKEWKKLIKTTDFTLGSKMLEFEKKFSKYIGTKYCVATNNGTDENFIHKDVLRIEAQGLEFVSSISFNSEGKNLTELELTLAPSTIWNYDNLHVNAVIWEFDGSNYKFINVSAD
jgi:dTDP-4-amino-4,6-dideoxygalactose transaminase